MSSTRQRIGYLRQRIAHRFGVRMRSALAAAAVVAIASVLSGVTLVLASRIILTQNVDQSTTQRATQVAAALGDGGAGLAAALRPSPRDRTVVQVVDADGRVVAASASVVGADPISPLRPRAGQTQREQRRLAVAHNESFQIVATGVSTADGQRTVLVGQSLDEVNDGTEATLGALALGLPLLTAVVGVATFLFVGRSLRPVEAMRRQADTISAQNLHTRLPVPATTDEIAALATTMNTMLDRIEATTAAQRRFVADASHELRSPLATIHAGLDILEQANLPAGAVPHVQRMHRESARMAALINDLLLLARVDESGLRLRREDVDLDDLVYAERDRLTAQHPRLRVDTHVVPVRVGGDPAHLQRALRNLLDNAARHATGRVAIDLRAGDDHADLTVTDDGPGIPAADRDRVFDRFVRLDDARSRDGGGTGLGLSIARDIVVAHGGTLTVDDAPGGGAVLRIRLPSDAELPRR
ncbi:HAMP domain-containing sensor histidine kinase [Dactylosporangium sp. AC04546]|uniref:sensor histidine kinase n=1 Tax=Dactylosporangium sp. AC04546 TaxID=2862460 RepID=UPI001EDF197F|nr:HAMP domain-containing sensor histidine kinase [Dactylosporangium sp. AC04546]WVK88703.1 HAMP domain-containing sensor histidine kinase [Dactylosporangium sp. AC04546]